MRTTDHDGRSGRGSDDTEPVSRTVVPRAELSDAAWDALVSESTEGWLWQRTAFVDTLLTWPGRVDRSFAITDGDLIAAVVPAHVVTRRRGPVTVRRIESFGGPCRRDDLGRRGARRVGEAAAAGLRELAAEVNATWVDVTLPPLAPAWRREGGVRVNPLVELGAADRSSQTWVTALGGSADPWRRIQDGTRSQIRAAERDGVTVMDAGDEDGLTAYHRLHLATCARTGATPHPRAYFEAIWHRLVDARLAHALVAVAEGEAVAAITMWVDKGGATYATGASSARGQELHAPDLLLWRAIELATAEGCSIFDLGEATFRGSQKARTISAFKRKFASGLEPLFRARLAPATPLARVASRVASLTSR
jgi:hypothetical protein